MTCTQHTPVRETTGSMRIVAGDVIDDIEHSWICRQCGVTLSSDTGDGHHETPPLTDDELMDQALIAPGWERMPSDYGKSVYHDGNELVRPLKLATS